jgi:hypothetical protein
MSLSDVDSADSFRQKASSIRTEAAHSMWSDCRPILLRLADTYDAVANRLAQGALVEDSHSAPNLEERFSTTLGAAAAR